MGPHAAVKQSFFIRILLFTAFTGNLYVGFQSIAHTFGYHGLDNYLRWYPFKAAGFWNIFLLAGSVFTLWGLRRIYQHGTKGLKPYLAGKLITCIGYSILIWLEYQVSNVPFPWILLPVVVAIEAIYPMLLYISLRKSKARTSY
jgi:mannose/fructose/N-acetylgalactosamine-specific phosphotransferase system component IIC